MIAEPAVSVIMAARNAEPYLREAMDSILNQSWTDFEFIIVDDASEDRTAQILAEYAGQDPRIVVLTNTANRGLGLSLNEAIERSRGEYLFRMDADDVSFPDRLKIQKIFMDAHKDVGICGAGHRIMHSDNIVHPETDEASMRVQLLFGPPFCHPTVAFRKSAIGPLRYSDLPYAQDYELWTRAARSVRFANIPETLLDYRVHGANAGKRVTNKEQLVRERIRRPFLESLGLHPDDGDIRIHSELSNLSVVPTEADLSRAGTWIEKIIDANKKNGFFDQAILEKRLAEAFFSFLWYGAPRGLAMWRGYRAFAFTRGRWRIPFGRTIKALIRCLLRWKKEGAS